MGRRILRVSKTFFREMLTEGCKNCVVKQGLPPDARIVKISIDAYFNMDEIGIMFESTEWPEAPGRVHIPEIEIIFQDVRAWLHEQTESIERHKEWVKVADAMRDKIEVGLSLQSTPEELQNAIETARSIKFREFT